MRARQDYGPHQLLTSHALQEPNCVDIRLLQCPRVCFFGWLDEEG